MEEDPINNPILLKTILVMKNKENLRNCHSQEESKEEM